MKIFSPNSPKTFMVFGKRFALGRLDIKFARANRFGELGKASAFTEARNPSLFLKLNNILHKALNLSLMAHNYQLLNI